MRATPEVSSPRKAAPSPRKAAPSPRKAAPSPRKVGASGSDTPVEDATSAQFPRTRPARPPGPTALPSAQFPRTRPARPPGPTALPSAQFPGRQRENFPVALRVLPARYRADLLTVYRYARHVDTLGDASPGDRRSALTALADEVSALFAGRPVREPAVADLAGLVDRCHVPPDPLLELIQANLIDQDVRRYATFDDLLGYCRCSADPVGVLVLHVFGCATPKRVRLSNRICTGLQLIEHWQDIGEDYAAGRVYLPQDDLVRYGVVEADLGRASAGPRLRALLAFETDRALAWLNAGSVLASTLPRWPRLAVSGYLAGGRAAAARLRARDYDPLPTPPKPRGRDIAAAWAAALVRWPG